MHDHPSGKASTLLTVISPAFAAAVLSGVSRDIVLSGLRCDEIVVYCRQRGTDGASVGGVVATQPDRPGPDADPHKHHDNTSKFLPGYGMDEALDPIGYLDENGDAIDHTPFALLMAHGADLCSWVGRECCVAARQG